MPGAKMSRMLYYNLFKMVDRWLPERFLSKYDALHFQKMHTSTQIHMIVCQVSSFICSVANRQVFSSLSDPASMESLPDVACRSKRPRLGVRQSLHTGVRSRGIGGAVAPHLQRETTPPIIYI